MIRYKTLKGGESRIIARRDTEIDRQALLRVCLVEGRGKAFVEVGFGTLDRADNCDMRNQLRRQSNRDR